MKLLYRVAAVLAFGALLAAGLAVMGAATTEEGWKSVLESARANRLAFAAAGFALGLLAVLFGVGGIFRNRGGRYLTFYRDGGMVNISTKAIEKYVARLAPDFPSVTRMRPRVITARESVDIMVDITIKASPHVHDICELLQQRVRDSVVGGLGIPQVRYVEVNVRKIVGEARVPSAEERAQNDSKV